VALIRLSNDSWGFATNCFVCEPENEFGLRIPFFHDNERDAVVADFTLDNRFSGAPTWGHGGISLAVCDEAMAWAVIAIHEKWAVTRSSSAEFTRPVLIGAAYRCEAVVDRVDDTLVETSASIFDVGSERLCVSAKATMSIVTALQAPAMGLDLTGPRERYLRDIEP
jgi:acyl-coenzyme A thioesterase PaaI-like protein